MDSGARRDKYDVSSNSIHCHGMCQNIKAVQVAKDGNGVGLSKSHTIGADLHLNMRNTTGEVQTSSSKTSTMIHSSITILSKSNYSTTNSPQDNRISGPLGVLEMIKSRSIFAAHR